MICAHTSVNAAGVETRCCQPASEGFVTTGRSWPNCGIANTSHIPSVGATIHGVEMIR